MNKESVVILIIYLFFMFYLINKSLDLLDKNIVLNDQREKIILNQKMQENAVRLGKCIKSNFDYQTGVYSCSEQ